MTRQEFDEIVIEHIRSHWPAYTKRMLDEAPARATTIFESISRYMASDVVSSIDRYSSDHLDETNPKFLWQVVIGDRIRAASSYGTVINESVASFRVRMAAEMRHRFPRETQGMDNAAVMKFRHEKLIAPTARGIIERLRAASDRTSEKAYGVPEKGLCETARERMKKKFGVVMSYRTADQAVTAEAPTVAAYDEGVDDGIPF